MEKMRRRVGRAVVVAGRRDSSTEEVVPGAGLGGRRGAGGAGGGEGGGGREGRGRGGGVEGSASGVRMGVGTTNRSMGRSVRVGSVSELAGPTGGSSIFSNNLCSNIYFLHDRCVCFLHSSISFIYTNHYIGLSVYPIYFSPL